MFRASASDTSRWSRLPKIRCALATSSGEKQSRRATRGSCSIVSIVERTVRKPGSAFHGSADSAADCCAVACSSCRVEEGSERQSVLSAEVTATVLGSMRGFARRLMDALPQVGQQHRSKLVWASVSIGASTPSMPSGDRVESSCRTALAYSGSNTVMKRSCYIADGGAGKGQTCRQP